VDLSHLGPWMIGVAALLALTRVAIIAIALRGTTPMQRPAILRSLSGRVWIGRAEPAAPDSESAAPPAASSDR
jgi:hypothetical protein